MLTKFNNQKRIPLQAPRFYLPNDHSKFKKKRERKREIERERMRESFRLLTLLLIEVKG